MANNLVRKLKTPDVIEQFKATAGKAAESFAGEVAITILNNPALEDASLNSVITEATKASALGLSLLPTVGEAYLVPFKGNAQFQLGYKGLLQLAMRSGQMKSFGSVAVYEGENPKWDKYSQELVTDGEESGKVVGYYAFFTLINGFRKSDYWTIEKIEAHRNKFSKSKNGPWKTDFDSMAKKTVLKSLIQYAPKSSEMQRAMSEDTQSEINQTLDVTPNDVFIGSSEQGNDKQFTNGTSDNPFTDNNKKEPTDGQLFDELGDLSK
ncbi:recombinase RecT [Convivina praedatoris]|uniref:recombinase RecT n=1 Tax=Convivina praedatoris TaxID=2880963 RepID=UPI0020105941|nr:recombinase RecT [Convivina sp. LMG 32447]CAH1855980.1 Protein RecT [Convivina sp. LMG 32447]